jgi:hypothetical protein
MKYRRDRLMGIRRKQRSLSLSHNHCIRSSDLQLNFRLVHRSLYRAMSASTMLRQSPAPSLEATNVHMSELNLLG